MSFWARHQIFEKNSIVLVVGILVVIAISGLVEITPLFYLKSTIEKVDGMRPYTPLELAGRNIYVREDVILLCHGGPISMPDDARYILDRCRGLHGFYGASSMERLPAEASIARQTADFKAVTLAGAQRTIDKRKG